MVEFALVIPLLLFLTLGTMETAVAWNTVQTVVQSSRSGARTVSQVGDLAKADQVALGAVKATFESDYQRVQRVVIYEATAANNGEPPAACIAPGVTTVSNPAIKCNVYTTTDLDNVTDDSRFWSNDTTCQNRSVNYCPVDRERGSTHVGVWVEYERDFLTGLFPSGSYTVTEITVMRVEPRVSP